MVIMKNLIVALLIVLLTITGCGKKPGGGATKTTIRVKIKTVNFMPRGNSTRVSVQITEVDGTTCCLWSYDDEISKFKFQPGPCEIEHNADGKITGVRIIE